jgi:hypothetical protein
MNFRSRAPRCSPIRTQMLTALQSSSWQEKLYSSFCVIIILAMLGVGSGPRVFHHTSSANRMGRDPK